MTHFLFFKNMKFTHKLHIIHSSPFDRFQLPTDRSDFLRHRGIVGHRALSELNEILFANGCAPQEAFVVARHVEAPTQQTKDIPTAEILGIGE